LFLRFLGRLGFLGFLGFLRFLRFLGFVRLLSRSALYFGTLCTFRTWCTLSAVIENEYSLARFYFVPRLDPHFLDLARNVRRHLDRRLVRLELEDRLIDRDGVTRLHEHFQHIALRDAVAKVREDEFCH
jgi:hypothetical protein